MRRASLASLAMVDRGRCPARVSARDPGAAADAADAASPESFRRRVRAVYALTPDAVIQGLCPLDVNARNIDSYEQGRWELVRRDVAAALGDAVARRACAFLDDVGAIQDAFGIRTNAVNFKKVLLRVLYETEALELRLRRLLTYYRGDMHKDGGYRDAARFRETCAAHGRCRGAMKAICDARVFLKQICCVPRHPECYRPKRLATMPRTMITRGFVVRARAKTGRDADADRAARDEDDVVGYAFTPRDETQPSLTNDFDRLVTRAREELRVRTHEMDFIVASLVTRGVAKALVVREELRAFSKTCGDVARDAEKLASRVRRDHDDPDIVMRERFTVVDEETGELHASSEALEAFRVAAEMDSVALALEGSAPALAETKRWIDEALANPRTRLFAAGDDAHTTSFVPDGFALVKMVSEYAETIERYEPGALAELARAGRVDGAAAARVTRAEGTKRCGRCDRSYSKLWIVGSTCVLCEQAARDAGRCPISPACPPGFFCPHARACLRCERAACDACGVSRGDAEDVAQLVETTNAFCVFLDFDRTICATKAGASPLPKNFRDLTPEALAAAARRRAVDKDFVSLLRSHGRAYVVTRNSNVDAIETYLRAHGVARPKVRRVMPGESKGPTIRRALDGEVDAAARRGEDARAPSVFVDDDVRELLRDDVREMRERVKCVLFSRAAS